LKLDRIIQISVSNKIILIFKYNILIPYETIAEISRKTENFLLINKSERSKLLRRSQTIKRSKAYRFRLNSNPLETL